MTTRIKLRRDTAVNWNTANPILALGEAGYDTTNNALRVGDGVNTWDQLKEIAGGLSASATQNQLITTLQSGLPAWLTWKDRGIYTLGVDYGSDRNGVWFSNSEDIGGGPGGTGHPYAFPLQSNFVIPHNLSFSLEVEFYADPNNEDNSDHAVVIHPASAVPSLAWTNSPGPAGQLMVRMNGLVPELQSMGDWLAWSDPLVPGEIYTLWMEINTNGIFNATITPRSTGIPLDNGLNNGIKSIEYVQYTTDIAFSLGADNDFANSMSYFRNLKVTFYGPALEVPQAVTFTANGHINLPGDMLVGSFRDQDYVVWGPEHAEYTALWWGGDRGGDIFTQQGYGPNVSVSAGRVEADDGAVNMLNNVPVDMPFGTITRPAEGVVLAARDQTWVFHENGNIYIPPGGTIRNEYNQDVLANGQGTASNWQDGVNDSVWRLNETFTGTKEFELITPGYTEIILTVPSTVTGATAIGFAIADYPALNDFMASVTSPFGNPYWLYIGENYGITLNNYNWALDGSSVIFSFDAQDVTQGQNLVVKYITAGSTYTNSFTDTWDGQFPDGDVNNSNLLVIRTTEYFNRPWEDLINAGGNITHNSITFYRGDVADARRVTSVTNNNNDTITIQFDGNPVTANAVTATVLPNPVITNIGENSNTMEISNTSHPDFERWIKYGWETTATNRYTGGSNSRSGYITINGGQPIDFYFYGSRNTSTGDFQLNLGSYENWSPLDTIVITYYRVDVRITIDFYRPSNGNINSGVKWLDWNTDLPGIATNQGHGIMAGTGYVMVATYKENSTDTSKFYTEFSWSGMGYSNYDPIDRNRNNQVWNLGFNNNYPFNQFDERGIVMTSNQTNAGFSTKLRVRVMYKWVLNVLPEMDYQWWC